VDYRTAAGETIVVRVALSPTSVEGALRNLEAEAPRADFEGARKAAATAWRAELSKIAIEGGTKKQRRTFYTALYHSFLAPTLFADADGSYRGLDGQVRKAEGFRYHSTFSSGTRTGPRILSIASSSATARGPRAHSVAHGGREPAGQMPVWRWPTTRRTA